MAADPITYCLEKLTDYGEFERLCCAILASEGYPRIEPLGGMNDGGLDAIVRDDGQGGVIAFAFTVRKDWFDKLKSDSARVAATQDRVRTLVYVCSSRLSATEKNRAFERIRTTRGWHLELYDVERLRMLVVRRPDLIEYHPSIFSPRFFRAAPSNFAQDYLKEHARLFSLLAHSTNDLATEIEESLYRFLRHFVNDRAEVELICHDSETSAALINLHESIGQVWAVISDEHYIPSGWRWKFDNRERSDMDVQAILRAKKVEITPLLERMRNEINEFAQLARR